MGRARLRLELLAKEKARRKTYETRKKGLEKKAKELSTLCGVNLCMIMYPPPLKNEQVEPFVWSNNPDQVANLIESHRLGDECSRSRTCDLSWFYKDQTKKIEEEIEKLKAKNREAKYPYWDKRYDSLSLEELRNLAGVLTDKIDAARGWCDFLKERKLTQVITESNASTNPVTTQENSGFTMLGMLDGRFVHYFDLEYQRRMASCGFNPAFNDHIENINNGVINVNPMMTSYDLETAFDQEPQHIGQGLMITNPAECYYFPHMPQHYIGQGFMASNPPHPYKFPQMDASYNGENCFNMWNF